MLSRPSRASVEALLLPNQSIRKIWGPKRSHRVVDAYWEVGGDIVILEAMTRYHDSDRLLDELPDRARIAE